MDDYVLMILFVQKYIHNCNRRVAPHMALLTAVSVQPALYCNGIDGESIRLLSKTELAPHQNLAHGLASFSGGAACANATWGVVQRRLSVSRNRDQRSTFANVSATLEKKQHINILWAPNQILPPYHEAVRRRRPQQRSSIIRNAALISADFLITNNFTVFNKQEQTLGAANVFTERSLGGGFQKKLWIT